ncbi:MAG: ABC transporter ATP-binding protein [Gammaproteobacteria bacterium]
MLSVTDLVVGYEPGSSILQGVNLDVAGGEVVALMGRNGMGKTTFLRTVMGHLRASSGEIVLDGVSIGRAKPYEISNLGVGYVPQGRRMFAEFTAEQNLLLGLLGKTGRPKSVPGWIYERFPILAARRRQRAGTLSGGEQQQLALARALIARPRLLLLDEPSEGIQPSIVQAIAEIVRAVAAEQGLTVVVVEQNLELVKRLASRCLFIDKGRIAHSVGVARLRADASLIHRYLSV